MSKLKADIDIYYSDNEGILVKKDEIGELEGVSYDDATGRSSNLIDFNSRLVWLPAEIVGLYFSACDSDCSELK